MGPLHGVRVVELAGIGPGPLCAMLLADLGADVLRVERRGARPFSGDARTEVLLRGRRSIAVDLKKPEGVGTVLRLVERADLFLEGFRPGVTERLGLGPDACLARNPRLVYGRMTGWGQDGPLAQAAGHDINYIALTGVLDSCRRKDGRPYPPLNLIGDFGGGALYLAMGLLAGLIEARSSGKGQVIDAAMIDGASSLMSFIYGLRASGLWSDEPGTNLLDTGAPYYDAYETADGKYVAIGAIEPQFYAELLKRTGLDRGELPAQNERMRWPELRARFEALFRTKTRDEWCAILEGTDACFAPVLSMREAPHHPHNVHRQTFVEVEGVVQPSPAPRFARTPLEIQRPPSEPGADTDEALGDWGLSESEVAALRERGVVG